jgi:outer membrane receptor protein involved in Fe transport
MLLPVLACAGVDGFAGKPIADIIDDFTAQGYRFAYSTNLVPRDLLVLAEPSADEPIAIVREILEPHGLTVRVESGVLLIVRQPSAKPSEDSRVSGVKPAANSIEEVSVSASRYEIASSRSSTRVFLEQRTIQATADFGDDPLRVVQRLPGAAASGTSARTHFRGGEDSEIGIVLNGQRLFDPFHVRDYQSIFSAVDSRAIDGVEVFTGGFPVQYGDRMSGMILMDSLAAPPERHNEIGVSVYNTSILTAGESDNRQWLLSARRGNLDLVIDPKFGSPSYSDVFGRFGVELSPGMTLAINSLYADDNVEVILESDPEDLQQVSSDTRNLQVWIEVDNRWSEKLTSRTVLSVVDFANLRNGVVDDEESIVGSVNDAREVTQYGFRQDFSFRVSIRHAVDWGLEVRRAKAEYDYRSVAEYSGLAASFAGQPDTLDTAIRVAPEGASYSLYLSDRWRVGAETLLEWGLRWDDQTYTGNQSDAQLSPRVSLLRHIGDNTEVRLSWGRYHQAQDIHELQVEDGVSQFWPAQRADQLIAGITWRFDEFHALRIEAFQKAMRTVRPRFENLYDPLGVIPEIQPDRIRIEPSSATARGIELSFGREGPAVDWWATYTRARVVDDIDGREELRSWDQEHALQLGFNWNHERWDVSLAASVHSGWPLTELALLNAGTDDDGEPAFIAVPGPRNTGRYPAFASLDFRVARTWNFTTGSLMAFIEVTNLTNRRNECCLDWDLDENDETGSISLERGVDYWMPLLPAVGFLWEF